MTEERGYPVACPSPGDVKILKEKYDLDDVLILYSKDDDVGFTSHIYGGMGRQSWARDEAIGTIKEFMKLITDGHRSGAVLCRIKKIIERIRYEEDDAGGDDVSR